MPKKVSSRKKLSRKDQKNLDIEIDFLEGLVQRDPSYVDALQLLGDDYTKRGKFKEGLRIDEKLLELKPTDPMVHYNLACSYSLTNQVDLAAQALDKALNLGYRDFKWLADDPDLENLRQHPHYKKLREKIRSLQIKIH